MAQRERVVCIGNATVDRTFALDGPVEFHTKNPAVARPIAFGGVARNVAENLARLGVAVELVAGVGDDDAGHAVLADCRALGIAIDRCVVSSAVPTPQYVAIIGPDNELVIGGSDMRAIEALPAMLVREAHASAGLAWTFADCNLSAGVLAALIAMPRAPGHRLAIDAVSVAKGLRLPADLRGIDLLFCNEAEARAYLARPADDAEALAQALHARGAQTAIMTLGRAGAIVADADGVTRARR
jgi:pseudouridine kinase